MITELALTVLALTEIITSCGVLLQRIPKHTRSNEVTHVATFPPFVQRLTIFLIPLPHAPMHMGNSNQRSKRTHQRGTRKFFASEEYIAATIDSEFI